jgi:predicted dienelactone hydrolase
MKPAIPIVAWLVLLLPGSVLSQTQIREPAVRMETLALVDGSRNRAVPVVTYTAMSHQVRIRRLAIISHGYGGKNTDYSFIANHLATRGYFVASIQHEIPGDEPLPKTGNPYETRKPSWERGVANILFVVAELKKKWPDLNVRDLVLIGHSHGGDTSMLFAKEHPDLVHTVISLDNRRMPIPRIGKPRLFSLRSSDQPADDGVIPSPEEQTKFGIKVIKLPATIHNDMWDGGTPEQKSEIIRYLDEFLRES